MSRVFAHACEYVEKQQEAQQKFVLFVVGATASGKSGLAVELAQKYDGEIISLDSRQFYKDFNIGTNKVTTEEMGGVAHHLIDVSRADTVLTLVDVMKLSLEAIESCFKRGKLPICVGGTGLYTDALCRGYDSFEVQEFEGENDISVLKELRERVGDFETLELAIDVARETLYEKINTRVDEMMDEGLLDEVKALAEKYDRSLPAMSGIGYKQLFMYLDGEVSLETGVNLIKRDTRRYAKRQLTWFRHHGDVKWLEN